MKKLISFFLIIFVAGTILNGCGKATLTDMVDRYEFCGVEGGVIYWEVYFNDDYKSSSYDYEDFIDVIKECMSRSGQYSFSNAWILAFDSDGYTNRFSWNTTEDRYVIVQKDGTIPNLREYEWKLTAEEVNEIWDSIGYKAIDDEEALSEEDTEETTEEVIEVSLEDGEVSEDYYWQLFYIKPEYDEFKTPASENGLDGTLIYVDGTVTDIGSDDEFVYFYLIEDDGNIWLIGMYNDNPIIPEDGDRITVYGDYLGQSAVYDEKPSLIPLRYISGDNEVKMIGHGEDESTGYLYLSFEGYPSEYMTDANESENNGFYHCTVTLSEWDGLDFDNQCSIARNWVEYYSDLFAVSGLTDDDFDITAYDESGKTAFIFNGGDTVEIFGPSI